MAKFNDIRGEFFGKYLKETEWRFNKRDKIEKRVTTAYQRGSLEKIAYSICLDGQDPF